MSEEIKAPAAEIIAPAAASEVPAAEVAPAAGEIIAPVTPPAEAPAAAEVPADTPPAEEAIAESRDVTFQLPLPAAPISDAEYVPTSLQLDLTHAQARVLATLGRGLSEAGADVRSPEQAIRRILDAIGKQLPPIPRPV